MKIIITGVSRGLGRAMATSFLNLGHDVYGCSRSASESFTPIPGLHFSQADVSSPTDVAAWAERLIESAVVPDILINNAAVVNRNAVCWELEAEEFNRLIDINIKGVMNVMRSFIPAMIARKRGLIVNFSSGWGRSTSPEVAPYCASKWAIEGLTQSLAQELPAGLSAVSLNPGIIDTDMLRSCFNEQASSYPQPREWAEKAVPFILKIGPRDNGKPLTVPV